MHDTSSMAPQYIPVIFDIPWRVLSWSVLLNSLQPFTLIEHMVYHFLCMTFNFLHVACIIILWCWLPFLIIYFGRASYAIIQLLSTWYYAISFVTFVACIFYDAHINLWTFDWEAIIQFHYIEHDTISFVAFEGTLIYFCVYLSIIWYWYIAKDVWTFAQEQAMRISNHNFHQMKFPLYDIWANWGNTSNFDNSIMKVCCARCLISKHIHCHVIITSASTCKHT